MNIIPKEKMLRTREEGLSKAVWGLEDREGESCGSYFSMGLRTPWGRVVAFIHLCLHSVLRCLQHSGKRSRDEGKQESKLGEGRL